MRYSVIMPARNEEDNIRKAIQMLLEQTAKPDEIIVVDAGSTDKTSRILEELKAANYVLKIIYFEDAFPGKARNAAIKEARNDILLMIDAGMYARQDWAEKLLEVMEKYPDTDVVFGTTAFIANTFFEKCAATALGLPSSNTININGNRFKAGAIHSSAIRKQVWSKAGGFLENVYYAEDISFIDKIRRDNIKIRYAPDAQVLWIPKQHYSEIFTLGRRQGRDVFTLGIKKDFVLKLFVYNALLFCSIFAALLFSHWYLLFTFLLVFLRLLQRIRDNPDVSRKIAFNPIALLTVSSMFILYGISILLGYFERMLYGK